MAEPRRWTAMSWSRCKRHAPRLYEQVRLLLRPGGELLTCDHLPDGTPTPRHRVLYMEPEEKLAALVQAGFVDAQVVWSEHHLAAYSARAKGSSPS